MRFWYLTLKAGNVQFLSSPPTLKWACAHRHATEKNIFSSAGTVQSWRWEELKNFWMAGSCNIGISTIIRHSQEVHKMRASQLLKEKHQMGLSPVSSGSQHAPPVATIWGHEQRVNKQELTTWLQCPTQRLQTPVFSQQKWFCCLSDSNLHRH